MSAIKWNWEVIDGNVYILCNGNKIAKMLEEDVSRDEMTTNTTTITTVVNDFFDKKEKLKNQL